MNLDTETRKLAAIAYGESSVENNPHEIGGIAWAFANRARAWGRKTIDELLTADPNYTYAVKDGNQRYRKLMMATEIAIVADSGMSLAVEHAKAALTNSGDDLSNGAFWWDGKDFKTNFQNHPKVRDGFQISSPSHNIFNVKNVSHPTTIYWKVRDKKLERKSTQRYEGNTNSSGSRQRPTEGQYFGNTTPTI